jgi:hypothetical protein
MFDKLEGDKRWTSEYLSGGSLSKQDQLLPFSFHCTKLRFWLAGFEAVRHKAEVYEANIEFRFRRPI